ncbi:MAG: 2Fe-2S iron-sulfur cluster-binding protein [Flavobacteriales bacterium]
MSKISITIDGTTSTFDLDPNGATILDASIDQGIDAPYSCKGGVCTSCMAKVKKGEVKMNVNLALTDKEVQNGFILCCQSHPVSDEVEITWDL